MENKQMLVILFFIFALGFLFRIAFAYLPYFYEPDDFYHYNVVLQALANHGTLPAFVNHSGLPATPLTEPAGLYLVPIVLSEIFGIQHSLVIMQYVPLLFYVLEFLLAYLFIRLIWKDNRFILLSMFFAFLVIGLISRTMATSYRGDGFVSVFVLAGLYLLIKSLQNFTWFVGAFLSGIMFALACYFWSGGSFGIVMIFVGFLVCLFYNYVYDGDIPLLSFIEAYAAFYFVCVFFNIYSVFAQPEYAFAIAIGMVGLMFFFNMEKIMNIPQQNRQKAFVLVIASVAVAGGLLLHGLLSFVFYGNGFVSNGSNITASIQELQPPNAITYISSFGTEMFVNPVGYYLLFTSFIPNNVVVVFILWLIMVVCIGFYLTKHIDSENPVPMLLFYSYFSVAAYLMLSVIRFTAIFSIPFGILSALIIIGLIDSLKDRRIIRLAAILFLGMFLFFLPLFTFVSIIKSVPYASPSFDNASLWLGQNTPQNSLIITDWSDGSVVELLANRSVTADSVGAFNGTIAYRYSRFVFSNPVNGSNYLDMLPSNVPQYLFFRYEWLAINESFMYEGNFTPSNVNLNDTVYHQLFDCTNCTIDAHIFSLVYQNNDSRIYQIEPELPLGSTRR